MNETETCILNIIVLQDGVEVVAFVMIVQIRQFVVKFLHDYLTLLGIAHTLNKIP